MSIAKLKLILTAGFSGIAYALGGWDLSIQILLTAIVLDYVTGTLSAIVDKKWSWSIAYKGICRKFGYIILIMLAVMFERSLGKGELFHPLICFFLTVTDGLSTTKNLKIMGVPIPDFFMKELEQMEGKANGK